MSGTKKLLQSYAIGFVACASQTFCQIEVCFAWEFKAAEEDWGQACYATHKENGKELSIIDGNTLIVGPWSVRVKESVDTKIVVDKDIFSFEGDQGDYFGEVLRVEIDDALLDALKTGKILTISPSTGEIFQFSLRGAKNAISASLGCANKKEN